MDIAAAWAASGDVSVQWKSIGKDADAFDTLMERAAFLDVPRRDLVSVVANAQDGLNARDIKQARARARYWKGWVLSQSIPDSAMELVKEALELCDSAKYPYDNARFSILKADILRFKGNYADAYFTYRREIYHLHDKHDYIWEARSLVGIGAIMQDLGDYPEALRNYNEASLTFEKAGSLVCVTKNMINQANAYYLLGDKEKSMGFLNNLENNKHVSNDSLYIANVLVSRFQVSGYQDREAAQKAYKIGRVLNNEKLSVITMMSMGALLLSDGEPAKALRFFNPVLALTHGISDMTNRKLVLESIRLCYRQLGLTDSARKYEQEVYLLNDSLFRHESIENLRKAEHLATIHQYEVRIEQDQKANRLRFILILSVCGFLLIILILSICLLMASKRRAESELKLKEANNERLLLQNQQYSKEIDAKTKELASNTVLLAQKNAKLKELGEQITNMEQKGEIAETEGERLSDKIKSELRADDDWRYFKLRFDKVHPCFFMSLKETYPALSKTELRLCAYIRVGMSAKEIAQILSVRPETVNTSRYRIRKKMSLGVSDSLESVLENF